MTKTQVRRQVEVSLAGQTIRLKSDADEAYLQSLAGYVNQKIEEISRQTRTVSTQRVALLAAMDIADEYFRAREQARDFRQQVRHKSERLIDMLERQPAESAVE